MPNLAHLSLHQQELAPSAEWPVRSPGWCFVQLTGGVGYCFGRSQTWQIAGGDVLIVPPATDAQFRASQIGPVQLQYFHFLPELLPGLLTLPERKDFSARASSPERDVRLLPAASFRAGWGFGAREPTEPADGACNPIVT